MYYYSVSVTRYNELQAVLKRAYFVTVIDGMFCLGHACKLETDSRHVSVIVLDLSVIWTIVTLKTMR